MAKLTKNDVEEYKLNNTTRLVLYLAFVIVGIILCTKTYIKISSIEKALGVSFIITGCVYVWMSGREKKIFLSNYDVIFGILAALCGLLLIINPGKLSNNINLYYALFFCVCFMQKLVVALKLFKRKAAAGKVTLVTSLMLLGLGIIMLSGPFNTMSINEFCGVFAILYGVIQFSNTVLLNNHESDIVKESKK